MSRVADAVRETGTSLSTVFRNPGLRKINLALAGSMIGDWAYGTAILIWAYDIGGARAVGIWYTVRLVLMTIVTPFASTIVDRLPRKMVMISADLIRAAALLRRGWPDLGRRPRVARVRARDAGPVDRIALPTRRRSPHAQAREDARRAHGCQRDGEHHREPRLLRGPCDRSHPGLGHRHPCRGRVQRIDVPLVGPLGQSDPCAFGGARECCGIDRGERRRGRRRGSRRGVAELLHGVHGGVQGDLARPRPATCLRGLLGPDRRRGRIGRLRHRDGRADDRLRLGRRRVPRQRHGSRRAPGRARGGRPVVDRQARHRLRRRRDLLGPAPAADGDLAADVGGVPGHVHHRGREPGGRRERLDDPAAQDRRRRHGPGVRCAGHGPHRRPWPWGRPSCRS